MVCFRKSLSYCLTLCIKLRFCLFFVSAACCKHVVVSPCHMLLVGQRMCFTHVVIHDFVGKCQHFNSDVTGRQQMDGGSGGEPQEIEFWISLWGRMEHMRRAARSKWLWSSLRMKWHHEQTPEWPRRRETEREITDSVLIFISAII